MKWKDSDEKIGLEEDIPQNDYFDEEQFSPWSDQKNQKIVFKYGKKSLLIFLLIVGVVVLLTVLVMFLAGGNRESYEQHQIESMQERIRQLEERLEKYEAIDEKVTRIWEQAKSFEKFKDRFDRSEASISLRMDHLTMSLEKLQKQSAADNKKSVPQADKSSDPTSQDKPENNIQYHQVVSGDTIYSVSRKYNISMEELLHINQMNKNSVIVPGQRLIIRKK
jgi:hypothetical protein